MIWPLIDKERANAARAHWNKHFALDVPAPYAPHSVSSNSTEDKWPASASSIPSSTPIPTMSISTTFLSIATSRAALVPVINAHLKPPTPSASVNNRMSVPLSPPTITDMSEKRRPYDFLLLFLCVLRTYTPWFYFSRLNFVRIELKIPTLVFWLLTSILIVIINFDCNHNYCQCYYYKTPYILSINVSMHTSHHPIVYAN